MLAVPVENTLTLCLPPLCSALYLMILLVPSAPTSPREIKSYHLIDLSALDSPQTHRKTDSPLSFESSSPMFASLLESFGPVADQDFNELGVPALYLFLVSSLWWWSFHNVMMVSCNYRAGKWRLKADSRDVEVVLRGTAAGEAQTGS